MARMSGQELFASGLALMLLFAIVYGLVAWVEPAGRGRLLEAATIFVVVAIVAVASWTGVMWRKTGLPRRGPQSWFDWLGMFLLGLVMSGLFLAIDCHGLPRIYPEFVCNADPGISVIFTFGALCLTVIALPSALRAALLALLNRRRC